MSELSDRYFENFKMSPIDNQKRIVRLGGNADFVIRMLANSHSDTEVGKTAALILDALTRE